MFDTHCHLFDKRFAKNLDEVIIKSRDAGVDYFVIPGTSIDTSRESISLNAVYQNVYSAVGIHPTEKLDIDYLKSAEKILDELCQDEKTVALGETGLDYYHFESSPEVQKKYLQLHIKLALKHEKALVLHNRQATNDIIGLLKDNWQEALRGKIVFHCASFEDEVIIFSDKYECFMGVDGDITYDKFKQSQIKKVSLHKLVLETDSPLLLPEPLKSQKAYPNTPANLPIIADFLANSLSVSKSEVVEKTTQNAKRLFGIY